MFNCSVFLSLAALELPYANEICRATSGEISDGANGIRRAWQTLCAGYVLFAFIWPVRKCHFAYMWQIVGGVIPSNCGICTPEVAFSCYDLPHISEMEVFISCNLPHISEMKCVSLLRVQWSRPVRTAAPRYLYARRQSMAVYVG